MTVLWLVLIVSFAIENIHSSTSSLRRPVALALAYLILYANAVLLMCALFGLFLLIDWVAGAGPPRRIGSVFVIGHILQNLFLLMLMGEVLGAKDRNEKKKVQQRIKELKRDSRGEN